MLLQGLFRHQDFRKMGLDFARATSPVVVAECWQDSAARLVLIERVSLKVEYGCHLVGCQVDAVRRHLGKYSTVMDVGIVLEVHPIPLVLFDFISL